MKNQELNIYIVHGQSKFKTGWLSVILAPILLAEFTLPGTKTLFGHK